MPHQKLSRIVTIPASAADDAASITAVTMVTVTNAVITITLAACRYIGCHCVSEAQGSDAKDLLLHAPCCCHCHVENDLKKNLRNTL